MIHINTEKKTILFSKPYDGAESAPLRACRLLMGYECPECRRLVLAYFSTSEPFDIARYVEAGDGEYRVFSVPGAMGLELAGHDGKPYGVRDGIECPWTLCGGLAASFNVDQILQAVHGRMTMYQYLDRPSAPTVGEASADAMASLKALPGVRYIDDVCGRGEAMMLMDESALVAELEKKAGEEPAWSRKREREAWENRRRQALRDFVERIAGNKPPVSDTDCGA